MKSKLKKATDLKGVNESAYTVKLKTDLATLQTLLPEEKPPLFVLRTGYAFDDGESTLLVVGLSSDWKKYIKQAGWLKGAEAKQTSFGTCRREGDNMHVVLQKGKLSAVNFEKAIKKNAALKKLTWHIVEQLTDDENDDFLNDDDGSEAPATQGTPAPTTNEIDQKKATVINKKLVELVQAIQATKDPAEKKKLLLEIDALADQLYAIPLWEEYTPDKIEAVLAKIETMLAEQHTSDSNQSDNTTNQDKALAEQLYKQILALVPQIQQAANDNAKQPLFAQLDTLARQLYAVPKYADYTPDNIEKMLEQRQQAVIKTDLAAFNQAIAEKNKAEALRLQQQILSKLI